MLDNYFYISMQYQKLNRLANKHHSIFTAFQISETAIKQKIYSSEMVKNIYEYAGKTPDKATVISRRCGLPGRWPNRQAK